MYLRVGGVGVYNAFADVDRFIGAALCVAERAEDWESILKRNSQWGAWR